MLVWFLPRQLSSTGKQKRSTDPQSIDLIDRSVMVCHTFPALAAAPVGPPNQPPNCCRLPSLSFCCHSYPELWVIVASQVSGATWARLLGGQCFNFQSRSCPWTSTLRLSFCLPVASRSAFVCSSVPLARSSQSVPVGVGYVKQSQSRNSEVVEVLLPLRLRLSTTASVGPRSEWIIHSTLLFSLSVACLLACLLACLPACLPACLLACFLDRRPTRPPAGVGSDPVPPSPIPQQPNLPNPFLALALD